jgi:hypothetical protein
MYKYRAIASFFLWKDVCALAMRATADLLRRKGLAGDIPDFDALWADFTRYVEAKHATGVEPAELVAPVRIDLRYDIPGWLAAGAPDDASAFRFDRPRTFVFELTEEGAAEMTKALRVWTSRITGLSKLVTRIRVQSQVRTCRLATADPVAA